MVLQLLPELLFYTSDIQLFMCVYVCVFPPMCVCMCIQRDYWVSACLQQKEVETTAYRAVAVTKFYQLVIVKQITVVMMVIDR